jgi:hypothetical protein
MFDRYRDSSASVSGNASIWICLADAAARSIPSTLPFHFESRVYTIGYADLGKKSSRSPRPAKCCEMPSGEIDPKFVLLQSSDEIRESVSRRKQLSGLGKHSHTREALRFFLSGIPRFWNPALAG